MQNKLHLIFFIPFLLFPSLFVLGGVWWLSNNMSLIEEGIKVEGKVVEVVSRNDSDGDRIYYPIAQFLNENGETVTKELDYGTSPASYSVGDPISIVYRKETPNELYINSSFWIYTFPGIFIAMGALFELFAIGFFIKMLNRERNHVSNDYSSTNSSNNTEDKIIYTKPSDNNKDKGNPFLMK